MFGFGLAMGFSKSHERFVIFQFGNLSHATINKDRTQFTRVI
jgi:hypothetical protein